MATYTWNGTGFNESAVYTQFLIANKTSYFYEQNYNAFFTTDSTGYGFAGNTTPTTVALATVFTDEPDYNQYVPAYSSALLAARLGEFQSTTTNVINAYSQTSSSYVSNTLNQAVSGTNVSSFTALQMYAPFLTSPQTNFAFTDILNNWNNGPQIITNLAGLLANYQGILTGSMQKTKSVIDFKTKLLRQTTAVADETSKLQQTANNFLKTNTFSALASAFPNSGMPQFNQLLMNHNAALEQALCTLMPVASKGASIEGVINQFLGGKIYNIISPMDKIVADINNSNNIVSNLIKSIPTTGFTFEPSVSAIYENTYIQNQSNNPQINNLQAQANFANQALNLLHNVMSKIPTLSTIAIPGSTTNPEQIMNSLISSNGGTNSLTGSQQAIATLVNMIATTTNPPSSMYNPYVNPAEPSQGGSFSNIAPLSTVFGGTTDDTVTPPNLTLALDPMVISSQYASLLEQTSVNQPGVFNQIKQGDGVNIFSVFPHTPRNMPLDGSLGDYTNSSKIDVT